MIRNQEKERRESFYLARNLQNFYSLTELRVCLKLEKERGKEMNGEDDKGLVWKLPEVRSRELGKVGPAFGVGIGCGFGLAIGLIGGNKLSC